MIISSVLCGTEGYRGIDVNNMNNVHAFDDNHDVDATGNYHVRVVVDS